VPKIKKIKHRKTENSGDRYLITYADLITLLLGLFVILYSTSSVDEEKYKQISTAFADIFKPGSVLEGSSGVLEGSREGLPEPILPPAAGRKSLEDIAQQTKESLKSYIDEGTIEITQTGTEIIINLSEKLLFESAKADVLADGMIALDTLARILSSPKYQITVDGHTDSDPINTPKFPSNWHLSGVRALNVLYALTQRGVPEVNLSYRGFGAQRPIASNAKPEGKAINRRVEITISELNSSAPAVSGY
jgi:chemotaxis protein MotB